MRAAGDVSEVQVGDFTPPATPRPSGAFVMPAAMGTDGGAAEPSGGSAARDGQVRPQQHVRIELHRLDALMNLIGELVITRGRLTQLSTALDDPALAETVTQASRLIGDLRDEIMTSRMVPVWQVFDRFPRMVRDAARAVGKQVDFVVEGKNIELDRSMLDEIGEPVLHLLRNAIDHGLEPPSHAPPPGSRPPAARSQRAPRSLGRRDSRQRRRPRYRPRQGPRARAGGRIVDASRTDITDEELFRLISRPGFSTAEKVTRPLRPRGRSDRVVMNRVRSWAARSTSARARPGDDGRATTPLPWPSCARVLALAGGEVYAIPLTHVPGDRRAAV